MGRSLATLYDTPTATRKVFGLRKTQGTDHSLFYSTPLFKTSQVGTVGGWKVQNSGNQKGVNNKVIIYPFF